MVNKVDEKKNQQQSLQSRNNNSNHHSSRNYDLDINSLNVKVAVLETVVENLEKIPDKIDALGDKFDTFATNVSVTLARHEEKLNNILKDEEQAKSGGIGGFLESLFSNLPWAKWIMMGIFLLLGGILGKADVIHWIFSADDDVPAIHAPVHKRLPLAEPPPQEYPPVDPYNNP